MSLSAKKRASARSHIENFLKSVHSHKAKDKRAVSLRKQTGIKNPNYKPIDVDSLKDIYNSRMLLINVTKKLNIGLNTLRRKIKIIGLVRKKPIRSETILIHKTKTQEKNNNWNTEVSNQVIKLLFEKGVSLWIIAKKLNYPPTTVTRRIKFMKLLK